MEKYIGKSLMFFLILSSFITSCTNEVIYTNVLPVKQYLNRTQDFSFWQLAQFDGESQMGYIIKTDDGKVIVVDGGLKESSTFIEDYLVQLGGEVDTWLISHPHKDHIGALLGIIENGKILIKKIIHTSIDLDKVQLYESKNFEWIKNYYSILDNSGIDVIDPNLGHTFVLGEGVDLKILGIKNNDISVNLVNNSSLVFKITSKSKSILFLGDLGKEGGNVVLMNMGIKEIASDYVQMAHHGQGGVNKQFYENVNAQYALWPTPVWLWENNLNAKGENSGEWKTLEVRKWMNDLKIKRNFVSGLEGNVQID